MVAPAAQELSPFSWALDQGRLGPRWRVAGLAVVPLSVRFTTRKLMVRNTLILNGFLAGTLIAFTPTNDLAQGQALAGHIQSLAWVTC
ncbi:MAG: hypothetical protein AMJ69_09860 [Gammaproteobacteria bacterium SG8_47]|nr:MAG: hypothetical protein AMJ69_09860 [Gammaproteobacteria bacterium SG8_47]